MNLIDNLLIASEELHCNNLLVITWDYEVQEKIEGQEDKVHPTVKGAP